MRARAAGPDREAPALQDAPLRDLHGPRRDLLGVARRLLRVAERNDSEHAAQCARGGGDIVHFHLDPRAVRVPPPPSAENFFWLFPGSRSRSCRRTNGLFSASSPKRTRRTILRGMRGRAIKGLASPCRAKTLLFSSKI